MGPIFGSNLGWDVENMSFFMAVMVIAFAATSLRSSSARCFRTLPGRAALRRGCSEFVAAFLFEGPVGPPFGWLKRLSGLAGVTALPDGSQTIPFLGTGTSLVGA